MPASPTGIASSRSDRLAPLVAERVADVHREEPGERVEVALPVRVLEVAAVAADDDRDVGDLVATHAGEVHPEVLLGRFLEVERGYRGGGHATPCRARLADRYSQKTLPSAKAMATRKMALAMTLTCGGTATRAIPQTKTGKVCVGPATK